MNDKDPIKDILRQGARAVVRKKTPDSYKGAEAGFVVPDTLEFKCVMVLEDESDIDKFFDDYGISVVVISCDAKTA